jgi:hypothetical protein
MDSEPAIYATKVAHQVILLTTKERDFAQHVGLKGKIQSTKVSKKLEPQTERLRQSGRGRNTVEETVLCLQDQCQLGKIEGET